MPFRGRLDCTCMPDASEQARTFGLEQKLTLYLHQSHSLAKQVHEQYVLHVALQIETLKLTLIYSYLPKLLSHDPNEITTEHEIAVRNRLFNVDG